MNDASPHATDLLGEPEQRFITANDLLLSVLRWPPKGGADDAGDTVFLLHGFLDCARGMVPLARALREAGVGAALVAPDWRGHGDSEWIGPGGYYHFPDYVCDLDVIVRELSQGRLFLVGHSMGGGVASLFSGAFPDRVAGLVNAEGIGPPAGDLADSGPQLARWAEALAKARERRGAQRGMASLHEAAERMRVINPRLPEALTLELAEHGTRRGADGRFRWKFDPLHRTPSAYPFNVAQALEVWRKVAAPVLLVEGEDSPMSGLPDLTERRAAFAKHALRVIPGTGHMFHQEAPAALAALIAEFLMAVRESRFAP